MRDSIQRSSLSTRKNIVSEMAAASLFRLLLVTSLVFSHLICSLNAVPVTRTGSLMHGSQFHQLPGNSHMITAEKSLEEKTINGRMAVELNDYPGSGANNRHTPTPRAQLVRGCADC